MSQQINLINPSLIKQKEFLTPANIGLSYGLLLVAMVGFYGYTSQQLDSLQKERDSVVAQFTQAQVALNQATAARMPHEIDKGLEAELAKLESKQQMQMQILKTISQDSSAADKGIASYLRGFAKQTIDGLWLTGFSIDRSENAMTINGRSLKADLLPKYITKLSTEPVFSGHDFGGLHIVKPKSEAPKALPVAGGDTSITQFKAPYVEFELQALDATATSSKHAESNAPIGLEQVKS